MIIGIDFDNTIICYDQIFHRLALEQTLIPASLPQSKNSVRDYLREIGKEDQWTKLQGQVYGRDLLQAKPFKGVMEFLNACRLNGIKTYIVSHKTKQPFLGPAYDLHQAALDWLHSNKFIGANHSPLGPEHCFLETTKEGKMQRIGALGCTVFIDDLPEFLLEPHFPLKVRKILFDPHVTYAGDELEASRTWMDLSNLLLSDPTWQKI